MNERRMVPWIQWGGGGMTMGKGNLYPDINLLGPRNIPLPQEYWTNNTNSILKEYISNQRNKQKDLDSTWLNTWFITVFMNPKWLKFPCRKACKAERPIRRNYLIELNQKKINMWRWIGEVVSDTYLLLSLQKRIYPTKSRAIGISNRIIPTWT